MLSVQMHYRSMVLIIERGWIPAFPNNLSVIYGQSYNITYASCLKRPTQLITLEDLGLSAASKREEHKCQNVNDKGLL